MALNINKYKNIEIFYQNVVYSVSNGGKGVVVSSFFKEVSTFFCLVVF